MSAAVPSVASVVPAAAAMPRAGERFAPLLVVVLTSVIALWAIEPWPVGVFQDDGIYAILGKALASGEGYRYLNLPGAPAATHYPPGYPLVLALLWRLTPEFPANTAVFVFANVGFLAAAALGTWYLGRHRLGLSPWIAALTAIATVASVPVLMFGIFVMSEPLFMAVLCPALLMAERAARSGATRDALVAGVLIGLLAMVRTLGQFVAPVLLLLLVMRRRWWAAAAVTAGVALFVVPWQWWVAAHGHDIPHVLLGKYGPYGDWLGAAVQADGSFLWRVIWKNVGLLSWNLLVDPDMPATVFTQGLGVLIALSVVGVAILGGRHLASRAPVTLGFVLSYVAIVIAWPFEPMRFLWVLLPLFGLVLVAAARALVAWTPASASERGLRAAGGVIVGLLVLGYGAWNAQGVQERRWVTLPRSFTERGAPLAEWARDYTHPRDVLVTDDDPLVHLYSGRRTIPAGTFTPQEYLEGQTYEFAATQLDVLLREYNPRWVLCGSLYCARAAQRLMSAEPPRTRFAGALTRGAVFEVLPR